MPRTSLASSRSTGCRDRVAGLKSVNWVPRSNNQTVGEMVDELVAELKLPEGLGMAILAGERDSAVLAQRRGPRIRATAETIQKSLVGNWQPEHLFVLRQSRLLYQTYQQQIAGSLQGRGRGTMRARDKK